MTHSTPASPQVIPIMAAHLPPAPDGTVRLGVMTDTHLGGTSPEKWHNALDFSRAEQRLVDALARLNRLHVDAVVILGDLTHHGDETAMRRLRNLCASFPGPVRVVPGNHDRATNNMTLEEVLTGHPTESDHLRRVRTISTTRPETLIGVPMVGVDIRSEDGGLSAIGTPVDVAAWPDALTILLSHYPMLDVAEDLQRHDLRDAGLLVNSTATGKALRDRVQPTLVLHGHLHARVQTHAGAILQIGTAALIEPPHEVALVDLEPGRAPAVTVRRFSLHQPSADQVVPVCCPAQSRWRHVDGGWEQQGTQAG